jgi:hypothetical protein
MRLWMGLISSMGHFIGKVPAQAGHDTTGGLAMPVE